MRALAGAAAAWRVAIAFGVRSGASIRPWAERALAFAVASSRVALAFVARTSASMRARAERGVVVARPRVIAWARVAQAYATAARSRAASFARIPGRAQQIARSFDRTRI